MSTVSPLPEPRSHTGCPTCSTARCCVVFDPELPGHDLLRLLALGLIIMDPPAGRRGRGLHLTPRGQAVTKEAYPIWQGAQKRAIDVMGGESRLMLDSLLAQAERLLPG